MYATGKREVATWETDSKEGQKKRCVVGELEWCLRLELKIVDATLETLTLPHSSSSNVGTRWDGCDAGTSVQHRIQIMCMTECERSDPRYLF
jgi:hypothetical protein